jgi:hypothetical protein
MAADLVIPSLDAGDEQLFRYVNRPHENISFDRLVDGLVDFTRRFPGQVWLEILLLEGVTSMPSHVKKIADLVARIAPARVQLNTVCRPPAEEFALSRFPQDILLSLREFFPRPVDVISEESLEPFRNITLFLKAGKKTSWLCFADAPATSEDVAEGLGNHIAEALKRLNALTAIGTVRYTISEDGISIPQRGENRLPGRRETNRDK